MSNRTAMVVGALLVSGLSALGACANEGHVREPEVDAAGSDGVEGESEFESEFESETEFETEFETETEFESETESETETATESETETDTNTDVVPADEPTSEALIAAAVATGALDAETALLYRVYAAHGDRRLPEAYRGAPAGEDSLVLAEVLGRWASLTPSAQEALAPFFVPPIYPGSWYSPTEPAPGGLRAAGHPWNSCTLVQDPQWRRHDGTHVVVWYEDDPLDPAQSADDAELAGLVAALMDDFLWDRETTIMGRTPPGDGTFACNAGDGRYDFFLVDMNTYHPGAAYGAVTKPFLPPPPFPLDACQGPIPSQIVLNAPYLNWARKGGLGGAPGRDGYWQSVIAHEFMHAIQFGVTPPGKCLASVNWWKESTAMWMAIEALGARPISPTEQKYGAAYMAYADAPIDAFPYPDPRGHFPYGQHLLYEWLELGPSADATFIPRVMNRWEGAWQAGQQDDVIAAANAELPGGFVGSWHDYGLALWNHAPFDVLATADGFVPRPKPSGQTIALGGLQEIELNYPPAASEIWYLGHRFFEWTVTDPAVRTLVVRNGYAGIEPSDTGPDLRVTGLFAPPDATPANEDWTAEEERVFCRSDDEPVALVALVASNRRWDVRTPGAVAVPPDPITVIGSNIHCGPWRGTVTGSYEGTTSYQGDAGAVSISIAHSYSARPTLSPLTKAEAAAAPYASVYRNVMKGLAPRFYKVTGGDATYQATYTRTDTIRGTCQATFTGAAPLDGLPVLFGMTTVGTPGRRGVVFGFGRMPLAVSVTSNCEEITGGADEIDLEWLELPFDMNPDLSFDASAVVAADGRTIDGALDLTGTMPPRGFSGEGWSRMTWSFEAIE